MRLLLTSAGLSNKKISDFFVSIIKKDIKQCSVFMIAYIQNNEEEFYLNEAKKQLIDIGIDDIDYFNLKNDKFISSKKYDVVYICGGNTYAILDRIRVTGVDIFLKDSVTNNNSLYLGVSAGSIIAGPDIDIAGWGSIGDTNDIELKNLTGLRFTNISIFPHFEEYLKSEVNEFRKKVEYPVIEITNDEAIFVEGVGYKIIK
jgi:peptidase E